MSDVIEKAEAWLKELECNADVQLNQAAGVAHWQDGVTLQELIRLARLGAAAEADTIYHCAGCNKWKAEPWHTSLEKESVDIDARSVATWNIPYCSDDCAAKHVGYESN